MAATIRWAPFDNQEPRVMISFWDKATHDEMCRRIKLAPDRPRDSIYAVACLT